MIIGDLKLKKLCEKGLIIPYNKTNVQAASIDLTLSNTFLKIESYNINLDKKNKYAEQITNEIIIYPKQFILGATNEIMNLPDDIAGFVQGRSSIGRIGLFIQNAGWIDPGFHGTITLELFNATDSNIILRSGRRICQIVFAYTTQVINPYNGKYNDQIKATESRIELDEEV